MLSRGHRQGKLGVINSMVLCVREILFKASDFYRFFSGRKFDRILQIVSIDKVER